MLQAKDWVLIAGIGITFLGFEAIPHGQSSNPKNNLSLFAQLASSGIFASVGFWTLLLGLLVICVSLFIPRR